METPVVSPPSSFGSTSSPPPELVADDTNAFSNPLQPWLECFGYTTVRWAPLPSHQNRLGVLVEAFVDMTESLLDDDDEFEHMLQVREAIDLILLALAVDPAAVRPLLHVHSRFLTLMSEEHKPDPDAVDAALLHGARTELRLRFNFTSIKTRFVERQLADHFIRELGTQLSTNDEYRDIRNKLLTRLRADPQALERMKTLVVSITVSIDSHELEEINLLDADDFFVHLTGFSKKLHEIRERTHNSQWAFETHHVPLVADSIELSLQRFCITHRVAQAVKTFMNAGVPVKLKRMNLDPRLISCADEDVRDFVVTLSKDASDLRIETGVDLNEELPDPIDEFDQDRQDTIRLILESVNQVEHIRELNLGGLLSLCVAPENRQEVWRLLFRVLLCRETPIESILIEQDVLMDMEEREVIREEAAHWRQKHPGKKLFIKSLCLGARAADPEDVQSLLNALDDVETFRLDNCDTGNMPSSILQRLLAFPSLKRLSLGRLIVSSMDIFDPSTGIEDGKSKPVLEELHLPDLILNDRASMPRFLEKLRWDVDEPSVLAKTLHSLKVYQYACGWDEVYKWNDVALASLERVLATNRVLRDVRVVLDYGDPSARAYEQRILDYKKSHLPANRSASNSAITKARNLAFLSVIRRHDDAVVSAKCLLDAVAVSRIFEYAAPHQMRQIEGSMWEDF